MSKLSKKQRFALALLLGGGLYLLTFGFIAIIVCGSLGLFPTSKSKRQQLVNFYSNDDNYTVIKGRANVFYYYQDYKYICLDLTVYEVCSENDDDYQYVKGMTYSYQFIPTNRKALEDNGLNDIYGECITQYSCTYYVVDKVVTITIGDERQHGMPTYAVALSLDDKEYLSYETGKTNMVNFIKYDLH